MWNETLVAGDVDEADLAPGRPDHEGEAEIDGDAARFLVLQAIALDAGQGFYQSRLAVVDMTRQSDDHGRPSGEGPGAGASASPCGRLDTKACSSSRHRKVEHEAVAHDPPDHRPRQGAQSSRQILDRLAAGLRPDRETGAGDRLERQRARSDLALTGHDLHRKRAAERPGDVRQDARGLGFDVLSLSREEAQGRQALGEPVRVAVEP